jgi:hypothetical protein
MPDLIRHPVLFRVNSKDRFKFEGRKLQFVIVTG